MSERNVYKNKLTVKAFAHHKGKKTTHMTLFWKKIHIFAVEKEKTKNQPQNKSIHGTYSTTTIWCL